MGPAQGQLERTETEFATSTDSPTPPWYAEHVEPEGIEQDIRRTRSEMDETLDALGEKLNPRHLLDDLIDYFRGPRSEGTGTHLKDEALHVAGRFSRNLMHQVAEHPLPSLLIGAGLAWLVYEQGEEEEDYGYPTRRQTHYVPNQEPVMYSGSYVDARTGEPYDSSYGEEWRKEEERGWTESAREMGGRAREAVSGAAHTAKSVASQTGEAVGSAAATVGQTASRAGHAVGEAASRAGHTIREAASTTAERASEWSHSAREGASQMGQRVRSGTGRVSRRLSRQMRETAAYSRESFEEACDEYPLAVGAGFLALGLFAGLLLPRTRREDELMGERADELKRQVRDTGEELLERGRQAAQATVSAVKEEAEHQGLTAETLADKAMNIASKAAESVKEAAKDEGLDVSHLKEKVQHVAERAKEEVKHEVPLDKLNLEGKGQEAEVPGVQTTTTIESSSQTHRNL